jgi:hypothetical protein
METLELRAHHVPLVKGFIYDSESLQDEGDTEGKRVAEEGRDFLLGIYGERMLSVFDEIRRRVVANPQIKLRVTHSQDIICRSCRFQEKCGCGDYTEVREAYEKFGEPVIIGSPIESDALTIQAFSLDINRTYTAEEILL